MQEICAAFDELEKIKRKQKLKNREVAIKQLAINGIAYTSKRNGKCFEIDSPQGKIEFSPSTGKFKRRSDNVTGNNVYELVNLIKEIKG